MTKAHFHLRKFRLLLLFLLCALFSLPLSAQEAYVEKSEGGSTLTFYYDANRASRSGKTWGINENIYNFFGSRVSAWAGTYYSPNEVVTKVVFDTSFQNFHPTTTNSWFYNLKALTTIEGLKNLNTSAVTNMGSMFYGCSSLKELNVSNFNTSAVTDMGEMFYGCSGLKELNVSNFNTSAVTDMKGMFSDCSSLKSLNLSNFNTSAVTKTNYMFSGCSGLTSLNVSSFNTSAVTNMSWMFKNCSGLKELNVSNLNTSKVTDMNRMFEDCSGLTSLSLSNFNTSAVTNMSGMFSGCSGLTSLSLSNFNTSAVTNMSGMFSGCSGLTSLSLSNFNTSAVTNMSSMFSGCSRLKTILNTNTWRCDNSRDMFFSCKQLRGAVKFDEYERDATMANPETGYFTDSISRAYVQQSEDQQTLTFYYDVNRAFRSGKTWGINEKHDYPHPAWTGTSSSPNKEVTKVVFDASFKNFRPTTTKYWFSYLKALTTIEGIENLNTSNVTDMSGMFSYCSNLTSLNLPNFNTSVVTNMSDMFSYCSDLTSLNLSNFNTSAVKTMGSMFRDCSSLTELNVSNFNTSAVMDMSDMFSGCSGLKELNVSNFNTSVVTNMSDMFSYCSGLKELNVSNFNTSAVRDMGYMFSGCSGLTSLNLSNFNTSAVTNMSSMFNGCSGLKTIFNTNTWRCNNSNNMFYGCTRLRGAVPYNPSKVDAKEANPETGYFTDPNPKAYVLLNEDKQTLTFFYDINRKSRTLHNDKTWDIDEKLGDFNPAWVGIDNSPNYVVKKVVFDASFKNYRPTTTNSWFHNLRGLTTIEGLENLNTSSVTDMNHMFSGCSGLKYLNVSYFNTSAVSDMSGMFKDCSSLKYINVSNFNIARVNNMSEMFRNCSNLKTIYNASTWQSEKFLDMFKGCTQLKGAVKYNDADWGMWMANPNTGYFTHPDKKMSEAYVVQSEDKKSLIFFYDKLSDTRSGNVWSIDEKLAYWIPAWAGTYSTANKAVTKVVFDASFKDFRPTTTKGWFYHLSALTTIEGLENLNTSNVTDMSGMFFYCSSLTSLNLSNFNTSKVTDMSDIFSGCSGLTSLSLSNFNTSAVTNMSYMFSGCSSLTSLNLSNFNISAVTDMSRMFANCSGLKTIYSANTWRCENSQEMFWWCTQLRGAVKYDKSKVDATMANPITGYFADPNPRAYVLLSEDERTLTFFYDLNRAFRSDKTWDIDEKKKKYNNSDNNEEVPAWAGTYNSPNKVVTKVVFDTSFKNFRPTTTNSWFYYLKALTTIEGLENFNTSAVTDMRGMFSHCSGLKELNLSNFNTSAVTDMSSMFSHCSGLKELNLSNFNTSAVTDMSSMFNGCSSLTSLNLSNFNTSKVKNMSGMFYFCSGLTSLNLSNFNTSKVKNMSGMFYFCSSLTSLNLSNFNTSAVTNMSSMFNGCSGLTSLNVSNLNTSAVTEMHSMFYGCSGLTSLNVSNFNTSVVTDMGWMFSHCSGLKELNLSNFNTSVVTDMGWMFYGCSGLKELNVSNFNTSKVTVMRSMFRGCSGLKELNVSNFNTSVVTNMNEMFEGCSGLKELNVSNFNTSAVTDMSEMFSYCSGLKTIINTQTWRCEKSQDMFKGCTQLKGAVKFDGNRLNVWMANTTTGYFTNPNRKEAYVLQSEDQHTLTFYYDNNRKLRSGETLGINETSSSSEHAWGTYSTSNKAVTKVVFDASFKDFRPTTTEGWFYHLPELATIEGLENLNTSAVTNMSRMFKDCSRLTSLNLSNFNTSAVTHMSEMFEGCSSLKELNVSNFNTSAVAYMNGMFRDCSGLKTIINTQTWRCEKSQDMFKGCTQLKGAVKYDDKKLDATMANPTTGYFTDPNRKVEAYVLQSEDQHTLTFYYDNNRKLRSGKTWDINRPDWTGTDAAPNYVVTKVVFDASFKNFLPTTTRGWFYNLSELTTIEGLENLNTSAVTNMSAMFFRCSGLTSLNLSNFNTSKVTNMEGMFSGCSGLKELNVSNFNTSKVTDVSYMFSGCSRLTSLNISNFNTSKVTNMEGMFRDCSKLTSLNLSNFNTSAVTNMIAMFRGCSHLTSLNLSNFNTSKVTNMEGMFRDCSGLKTIINTQTWRCEKSQDMFKGCTQLKGAVKYDASKLDVTMANPTTGYFTDPNRKVEAYVLQSEDQHTLTFYYDNNRKLRSGKTWDINRPNWAGTDAAPNYVVTKVLFDASFKNFLPTTTRGWFYDLSALTTIEGIENLNTSVVTDMSVMFWGCSRLTSLNLSNFNTSEVTNMEGMFRGCSRLTSPNLSNFNTSEVTNMEEMFRGCSRLTSPNLSNFNTSKVTNMSKMFEGCSSLKELNVSNFNTSKVTNMEGMFRDCSGLKTVINTQTWQCEKSQDMFKGCTQLNGAVKYDGNKLDATMANPTTGYFTDPNRKVEAYVLQSEDQHTLTFYYDNNRKLRSGKTWDIDEKSSSSKPVWAETYSTSDKAVTKVVFDASFKDFRPTTTEGWFYYLSELTTIKGLENLNTSAVTDMSAMFFRCSGLTSLNLSNFNTSAVTNMGWMFEGCSSLTSLNVSNFNTSKVTNMSEMFEGCSSLKELNISNFNTSAVTNMGQMFYGCSGLKELNVSNFNTSAVTDMSQMFFGSSGLTALNLSNFNTSAVTNMSWMFKNCSGLKELNVSNFNTSAVTNMGQMFYGCSGLKELNVSNFNTSAVINMSWMFKNCSGLKELNVSNFNTSAVTNMSDMFYGCSGLKTILNPNTWRCEQSQDMFKGCTQLKGAVKYDASKLDVTMANPTTGYFSQKLPSAIGRVVFDDNNATQIYNLQGKRVNANQRHLPAGFYIVNGKKVYLNEKP